MKRMIVTFEYLDEGEYSDLLEFLTEAEENGELGSAPFNVKGEEMGNDDA